MQQYEEKGQVQIEKAMNYEIQHVFQAQKITFPIDYNIDMCVRVLEDKLLIQGDDDADEKMSDHEIDVPTDEYNDDVPPIRYDKNSGGF